MAVRVPGQRSIRWRLGGLGNGPFLGGLNVRDEYTEMPPSDLALATNLTLDERGVAIKRNDCPTTAALAGASTPPGAVTAFFYSVALNLFLCQVGTTLYKAAQGAAGWTALPSYVASAGNVLFADFQNFVVWTHPIDGVYSYDGTTVTLRSAARNGTCIAVWQNKVFIGGIFTAGAGSPRNRIHWSGAGDVTTWASTDFIDLREKDEKATVALFPAAGALLVFKEDSTYRINDSTTGAYQTIDWNAGCVGPLAVTGSDEGIFHWGLDGLYRSRGIGPSINVGDKLRPRYSAAAVNATTKPLIAAVALGGRIYFAFPRTSTTIPDAILEYNPRVGWLMEVYFAARVGPFAKYINSAGAASVSFASDSATIKDLYTGTTRTGFTCSLLSAQQQLFGGYSGRIMRAAVGVHLPGTVPPALKINYLDNSGSPAVYGPITPAVAVAGAQQLPFLPHIRGKAFQLSVDDTVTPLNSLSIFDAQMDGLLVALR